MLKEWITKFIKLFERDVTSDIRERVTNPFVVSFIISWLAWNWKLVYIVFNFDENYILTSKIALIKEYLDLHYLKNSLFLFPVYSAFCAIIIFALLNQVALLISVFVRRQIRPRVYQWVGHKDIVDSETHNELKKNLYRLQDEYLELEKENSDTTAERNKLKNSYQETVNISNDFKSKLSLSESNLEVFKNKHDLSNLFNNDWYCEYILENGFGGEEKVKIIDGQKYMADGRHTFNIDMVDIDRENKLIKFRKVAIEDGDDRKIVTELKIVNENEYRGIENKNIIVVYYRSLNPESPLSFKPIFQPVQIDLNQQSKVVFNFKNNVNSSLEILSYKFVAIYNGKRISEMGKHSFKKSIDSLKEFQHKFGNVNPLVEYFNSFSSPGTYDSEITIEYRIVGNTDIKQITRIARLIVNHNIVIHSAMYGTEGRFINISAKVEEFVGKNIFEFLVSNELAGDPYPGKVKKLEIDCTINGIRKKIVAEESKMIKIE